MLSCSPWQLQQAHLCRHVPGVPHVVLVRGGQLREADRAARCCPHDAFCQQEVTEQGCHQQVLHGRAQLGREARMRRAWHAETASQASQGHGDLMQRQESPAQPTLESIGTEAGTTGNPYEPGHQRKAASTIDPNKAQQAA